MLKNKILNLVKRLQYKRLIKNQKTVKLHLGADNVILKNYINIDIRKKSGIDIVADAANLNFIKNKSVDEIYCSHVLEHMSHKQILKVLSMWFKLLKPTGRLVISVPDFNKIIEIYQKTGNNIWDIQSSLFGDQAHIFDYHYSVYNLSYIQQLLKHVGFRKVNLLKPEELITTRDWSYRKITVADKRQFAVSLNISAIK